MEKQILTTTAVRRELIRDLKVHPVVFDRALKFQRNSKRDQAIRSAALERGGFLYTGLLHAPEGYCPKVETLFDQARDIMYQSFGDRVALEVELKSGRVTVFIDHSPVAVFDDMTLDVWGDILYSLQQVYNQLASRDISNIKR